MYQALRRYRKTGESQEENDKDLKKDLLRKAEVLEFDLEKRVVEQDLVNLQKYKRIEDDD